MANMFDPNDPENLEVKDQLPVPLQRGSTRQNALPGATRITRDDDTPRIRREQGGGEDRSEPDVTPQGNRRYGGQKFGGQTYGGHKFGGQKHGGYRTDQRDDAPPAPRDEPPPAAIETDRTYGGQKFGGNKYGGQTYGGNKYGGQTFGGYRTDRPSAADDGPPFEGSPTVEGAPSTPGRSPYGNNRYGGGTYGGGTYGGQTFGGSRTGIPEEPPPSGVEGTPVVSGAPSTPGRSPYGNNRFGGNTFGGNRYGGNTYGASSENQGPDAPLSTHAGFGVHDQPSGEGRGPDASDPGDRIVNRNPDRMVGPDSIGAEELPTRPDAHDESQGTGQRITGPAAPPARPGGGGGGGGGGTRGGGGGAGGGRRKALGDQTRNEAYDPTLDRADPRNVAPVDEKYRVNPKLWEDAQKGAIDPTKPSVRHGEEAQRYTNNYTAALEGATKYMADMFHQKKGDPNQAEGYGALTFKGVGAPDPKVVADVFNVVDPRNELQPKERMELATRAMHDFYVSKGDTKSADKVAAEMLQYGNKQAQALGNQALANMKDGNRDAAVAAIKQAYDWLPDGFHADVQQGKLTITNDKGQKVNEFPLDDKQIANLGTGLATGTLFWDVVQDRAGVKDKFGPPQMQPQQAIATDRGAWNERMPPGAGRGADSLGTISAQAPSSPPAGSPSASPTAGAPPPQGSPPAAPAPSAGPPAPSAAPPGPPPAGPAPAPGPTSRPPPPVVTPPSNRPAAPAPAAPVPAPTQQATPSPVPATPAPAPTQAVTPAPPPQLTPAPAPAPTVTAPPPTKPAEGSGGPPGSPAGQPQQPKQPQPVWNKDDPDTVPTFGGKPAIIRRETYPVPDTVRAARREMAQAEAKYRQDQDWLAMKQKTTKGTDQYQRTLVQLKDDIEKTYKTTMDRNKDLIRDHDRAEKEHDAQERASLKPRHLEGSALERAETISKAHFAKIVEQKGDLYKNSALRLYGTEDKQAPLIDAVSKIQAINPNVGTKKIAEMVVTAVTHVGSGDAGKKDSLNDHDGKKGSRFLVVGEDLARNPVLVFGEGNSRIQLHVPKDTLNDLKRLKDESYQDVEDKLTEEKKKLKTDYSTWVPEGFKAIYDYRKGQIKEATKDAPQRKEEATVKPSTVAPPAPDAGAPKREMTPSQQIEADRQRNRTTPSVDNTPPPKNMTGAEHLEWKRKRREEAERAQGR